MRRCIAVVDLVAVRDRHASFNATILRAISGIENAEVLFCCSDSHFSVAAELAGLSEVRHVSVTKPDKRLGTKIEAVLKFIVAVWIFFRLAAIRRVDTVLLLEAEFQSVAALRFLYAFSLIRSKTRVLCLHHGSLHQWVNQPDALWFYPPWRSYLDCLNALAQTGCINVFLEVHIRDTINRMHLPLIPRSTVIPHPTTIDRPRRTRRAGNSSVKPSIGFFGTGTREKGFKLFLDLADDTQCSEYDFLAYSADTHDIYRRFDGALCNLKRPPGTPLSFNEYIRHLESVDFVFLDLRSDYYSMSASGILTDALSLGVPLLTFDCRYVRNIEAKYGAVGYVYADHEALRRAIRSSEIDFTLDGKLVETSRKFVADRNSSETVKRMRLLFQ